MKQTDQQGKDPDKTYFSTEMRKFSKQDEGRAALIALVLAEHQGCITFWPVAGSLNKFWGVIDKKLSTEQVTNMLNKVNKIQTGDKSGPLKTYLSFAMKGTTTQVEKTGGGNTPLQHATATRRVNTATIAISGWPYQMEPEQVREIFGEWGVTIDLHTVNLDWFFGTEAEGFTLKIETSDLFKARELLNLKDKQDFEFGIGELTATQQSHLRLIATSTKEDKEAIKSRHPKPHLPNILSETQLSEIKKSVNNPHTSNQAHQRVEVTILGKEMTSTKPVPGTNEWVETKNKKTKKSLETPKGAAATQEKGGHKDNAYAALGKQAEEEEEDQSMEDEGGDEKDEEKVEEKSAKKKSPKAMAAAAERAEKEASHKKYDVQIRFLKTMKLWGSETNTVVDAFGQTLGELGYDCANDLLEDLLIRNREEIKELVEGVVFGTGANEEQKLSSGNGKNNSDEMDSKHNAAEVGENNSRNSSSSNGISGSRGSSDNSSSNTDGKEDTKEQEEKTRMEEEVEPNPALGLDTATSSNEPLADTEAKNQGEAGLLPQVLGPDPPVPEPSELHKSHPPDVGLHAPTITDLSSSMKPKVTIKDYYLEPKTKGTSTPHL